MRSLAMRKRARNKNSVGRRPTVAMSREARIKNAFITRSRGKGNHPIQQNLDHKVAFSKGIGIGGNQRKCLNFRAAPGERN